jgi:hypothetical protein
MIERQSLLASGLLSSTYTDLGAAPAGPIGRTAFAISSLS